jgi:hypothetical protein
MQQITIHNYAVGTIKNKSYHTARNFLKNQIYYKKHFWKDNDGKTIHIQNAVGLSKEVCRKLLQEGIEDVYFELQHFPQVGNYQTKKIKLLDFLSNSISVKEKFYDEQRIIDIEKLESNEIKHLDEFKE